jgi:hypothetical protein
MRFISRHSCRKRFTGNARIDSFYDDSFEQLRPLRICPSCDETIIVSETYDDYSDLAKKLFTRPRRKPKAD